MRVKSSMFQPSVLAKRLDDIPTTVVSLAPISPPPLVKSTAVHPLHAGDVAVRTDWMMIIVTSSQLSTSRPRLRMPRTASSMTGSKSGRQ